MDRVNAMRRRLTWLAIRGLLLGALLLAWWWDRTRIAAELNHTRAEVSELRRERSLTEGEKRARAMRRVPGFNRIELGMTLAEVEEILGGPPGFRYVLKGLVTGPFGFQVNFDPEVQHREQHRDHELGNWDLSDMTAVVVFDENQRVVSRYVTERAARARKKTGQ